jgi:hypothetical protein
LCTSQKGRRTQQDLDREKENELTALRYTKFDERIGNLAINSKIALSNFLFDKERVFARLETLRKLKLCSYENGKYVLKNGWQEDLRNNGRYNVFLKAREELKYTSHPSLMKIYSGRDGLVTGKVTKIYRTDDDASDNHAVILEGLDGKAYFIPLLKMPELHGKDGKTLLKEGELASVKTYESQKGRLTPVFFKLDARSAQKEIKKNSYKGALADEMLKMKPDDYRLFMNS